MKQLIVLFSVLVMTSSAHAISLAFKMDIFSSGSDIYACNAGLMHGAHANRVCYERENPEVSCNPGTCAGQVCNCVCTGDSLNNDDQGEYRLDFLTSDYSNWADHGSVATGAASKYVEAGKTSFNQLWSNDAAFDKQLNSLQINLSSERYGAVYFLDVCYRATQIAHNWNASSINYAHDKQVTITDLSSNGYDYEVLAGLAVKTVVTCKPKNQNWYTVEETDWRLFNGSDVLNYNTKNIAKDLEQCKVRYLFKESNVDGLASIRRWNLQQARVCTYTSFNEPVLD